MPHRSNFFKMSPALVEHKAQFKSTRKMAEIMEVPVAKSPGLSKAAAIKLAHVEPQSKPIHTIILDSSPLLLNTPSLSTLFSQSQLLVTTQSVISEIRDPDARSRVENLYLPFLKIRSPKPESVKFVRDFARQTGDAAVLSGTDVEILALAYDLECERNGGDWRLRRVPGQKRVNGSVPTAAVEPPNEADSKSDHISEENNIQEVADGLHAVKLQEEVKGPLKLTEESEVEETPIDKPPQSLPAEETFPSDSDSEGWITPSNIKEHQAKDSSSYQRSKASENKILQVATITGDFAMQNVLLQMNLNLLSPKTCKRITQLKQTILRCHGCFTTTKDLDKQFCPRCGKPTLTRVSCTINDRGEVKLHLKANMQWSNKGNVFSIPKPVSGRSNQKWTGPRDGGGKSGWGRELVLAEDQKEYIKAMTDGGRQKGRKEKDLMDEDYLPSILTGDRSGGNGRIRIGGGRNVNSRKR
jgi:RNA-binding protein NOB1